MEILRQLGELFLQAVPTVLIILVFYFILRGLFFRPLLKVMAEREARTIGARKAAERAQQAAAENMLSGALRQLFALAEAYPDLKANASFQQLQAELTDIENKIAAARRFFNNAVQEYNTGIQRFPAALFASTFGFAPKTFFDLGDERAAVGEAPPVKF